MQRAGGIRFRPFFVAAKSWNINPPERRKIGNFKLDKVSSVLNHGTWTEDQMRPEGFEMALFFGVNVGLVESSDAFKRPGNSAATQPPRLLRWLFRKRQARFG